MRGNGALVNCRAHLGEWAVWLMLWCVATGPLHAADPVDPAAQASAPPPRVLRQIAFNIPFDVSGAREALEVHLFVSTNAGATWRFYARRHPSARYFAFRAKGDGEYWFASRTVDKTMRAPKTSELKPQLHVIVDTVQPEFEFQALAGNDGKVQASWRILDKTLDPSSLKIAYQARIGESWQQVPVTPQQSHLTTQELIGKLSFVPKVSGQTINVRAEVADRAGNKTAMSSLVVVPNGVRTVQRPGVASPPPDPFAPARDAIGRANNETRWPPESGPGPALQESAPAQSPIAGSTAGGASVIVNSPSPTPARLVTEPTPTAPVNAQRQPGLPPGERPRMTSAKRFQLDYQIDAVGPSGIKKVELWGTADGGRSWSVWTEDQDQRSPINVQVDAEGLYGFNVVIVGNNGLAGPAPRNGDLADLWVAVDMTPPNTRITSVIYGEGDHAGQLDIRWLADDAWLMDRPITLLFSDRPHGPWTTIAAGLEHTGQYFWSIDPRVPKRIYLRIEARDEAGNLGEHQLAEPIAIAGLIPKARIRGIRPTLKTSRGIQRIPAVR